MRTVEAFVGAPATEAHEVEIEHPTVVAFWRLGRALATGQPRDREVFALGRCIGSTPGITATLHAFGQREDPASFAISKLMYGGDQPMLDAYWQSPDDPTIFNLARQVYSNSPPDFEQVPPDEGGGTVIFDVSSDRARLAGVRFRVP